MNQFETPSERTQGPKVEIDEDLWKCSKRDRTEMNTNPTKPYPVPYSRNSDQNPPRGGITRDINEIMRGIGPLIDSFTKELREIEKEEGVHIPEAHFDDVVLNHTGTLLRNITLAMVSMCMFLLSMTLRGRKAKIAQPITKVVKMFSEELGEGEWDREFQTVDKFLRRIDFYGLRTAVEGTSWFLNQCLIHNRLSIPVATFLLGSFLF